jgi:hypothetical protein
MLFVGESWLGSCARSLKEALSRRPDVVMAEVNEDLHVPRTRNLWLRVAYRIAARLYRDELFQAIRSQMQMCRPHVVVVYKGFGLGAESVRALRELGGYLVNVYPDASPHAHGAHHKAAVGEYDLVISTKPYHVEHWGRTYGFTNACVFVPQGYDPSLHLRTSHASTSSYDVVFIGTWRREYGALLSEFGRCTSGRNLRVAIGGYGWRPRRSELPPGWELIGPVQGPSYVERLRSGRINIAPLSRAIIVGGRIQPGDEDSTRTYELAAAHCFFIHQRTPYVTTLYDEDTEVPMFDTAADLAEKTLQYIDLNDARCRMAAAAHTRAVPAYSLDERASEIVRLLRERLHL